MAPQVKLYFAPGACSQASDLLLENSGLPFEAVLTNIRDPEARAEYVKNVNSKGQVPALTIDGEVITEAPAIITAISQLVPEKHYTGKTPMENVRFYEWMNLLSGTIHSKAFGGVFHPAAFSDDPAAQDGIKAKSIANVLAGFKTVEEKLAARGGPKFALGDSLTGVDAYLMVFYLWAQKFGMDVSPFPNYTKVFENVSQLPAFKTMRARQA